jgi:hypothetical protein
MKQLLTKLFSVRSLTAIAVILIGYTGVLGYVADETDRDVQFWPPYIGPDPKSLAVNHMGELESDMAEIRTILDNELVSLNARLADARTNMAEGGGVGGRGSLEWRQNVRSYEKDIRKIQVDVISRIRKLESGLDALGKSCTNLGPVNE